MARPFDVHEAVSACLEHEQFPIARPNNRASANQHPYNWKLRVAGVWTTDFRRVCRNARNYVSSERNLDEEGTTVFK